MSRSLRIIVGLALIAFAAPAFAESGGPNPPQMSGNPIARAGAWEQAAWDRSEGMGKKSKAMQAMCEKMKGEKEAIDNEAAMLKLQCDGAKGLDLMNCESKMSALQARKVAMHDKMSMMHDKTMKKKGTKSSTKKAAPKAKKLPPVQQQ